jgi:ribosome-associated translation inhibitor RaiA
MRGRVNKLIETYVKRGALDTILLFKKYTDRMDFGITITSLGLRQEAHSADLFNLPDF